MLTDMVTIPSLTSTALVLVCVLGCGCGGGQRLSKENNRLRDRVYSLESEAEDLRRRNAELKASLKREAARPDSLSEDVRANIPHVARIKIGRLSHARDDDGDGVADVLVIYVQSRDGLNRHVQVTGTLSVNVALLPADTDAITIGQVTLSPGELREKYRASVTGLHYTIEVPLTLSELSSEFENEDACQVRVVFDDGQTGQQLDATRTISLTNLSTRKS